jgi:hypothetical protein
MLGLDKLAIEKRKAAANEIGHKKRKLEEASSLDGSSASDGYFKSMW